MSDLQSGAQRTDLFALRRIALLITLCTGFSGLVYEVTWHSYLSNLIGSQAQAASIILAVFLGSLSIGYGLFGRYTRNHDARKSVKLCGIVEIVIGFWAICFPSFYSFVWEHVGVLDFRSKASFLYDVITCFVLIGVPTTCMGGTLPLLTRGLSQDRDDASLFHARVYAINTGGAFLGCLLAGFVLLPSWGLPFTMLNMGILNVICGLGLVGCAARIPEGVNQFAGATKLEAGAQVTTQKDPLGYPRACVVSFIAGCFALTLQTVLIRLIGLSVGSSTYSFSMVVSAFILMLALGASGLTKRSSFSTNLLTNQALAVLGVLLLYIVIPTWPYYSHVLRTLLTGEVLNFYVYYSVIFVVICVLLAIPVGTSGRTLPLLFRDTQASIGEVGTRVGGIYGFNTFGCVIGALFGGHLLLYVINLDQLMKLCVGLLLCSLLLVLLPVLTNSTSKLLARSNQSARLQFAILVIFLGVASFISAPWPKDRFSVGTFRSQSSLAFSYDGVEEFYKRFNSTRNFLEYKDDPNTTVAVVETKNSDLAANHMAKGPERSLWVNGKSDGTTVGSDLRTMRLVAHLPALLNTAASKAVAVVGFGTGATVGTLTVYPDIERVDCIEIAPAVKQFAPYFDHVNHQASNNPKVNWYINDAYRVLSSGSDRYAVIISVPSNPWVTGVERLFAAEYYEKVKRRLDQGGIYAQWFHTYSMSEETLFLVFSTFSNAFPNVRMFANENDLVLLGSFEPLESKALEALQTRIEYEPVESELKDVGIEGVGALLGREVWFSRAITQGLPIHTLDFPKLSYRAGKDFFLGKFTSIASVIDNEIRRPITRRSFDNLLLTRWNKNFAKHEPDISELARDFCQTKEVRFYPDWKKESYPCQSAMIGMVATGKLEPYQYLLPKRLAVLREITRNEGSTAATLEEARLAVSTFGEYASPFFKIAPGRVRKFIEICYRDDADESRQCRLDFVQALAWNGYRENAIGELQLLQSAKPLPADVINLMKLLLSSKS